MSLLQQGIPGNPHISQFRHLFTPQAWRPAATARGQIYLYGLQACSPRAQKIGKGLATPGEILEKTGYPCGGTPSFGYQAMFLVDPKVM